MDYIFETYKRDSDEVKVKIWDTAGQERFRTITYQFYRQAHGVIICFDLTNENSFQNVKVWMTSIYKNADPSIYKILVGNKVDLDERVVSEQDAQKLAAEYGLEYYETSAKANINITEMMQNVLAKVYDK